MDAKTRKRVEKLKKIIDPKSNASENERRTAQAMLDKILGHKEKKTQPNSPPKRPPYENERSWHTNTKKNSKMNVSVGQDDIRNKVMITFEMDRDEFFEHLMNGTLDKVFDEMNSEELQKQLMQISFIYVMNRMKEVFNIDD